MKQNCRLHRAAAISLSQGLRSEGWMYFIYGEQCPVSNGFIHDRENDLCIKISEQQLKADEGEQFCTDNSAKLITLETASKQARFDRFLAKTPYSFVTVTDRYRIGLHYIAPQWVWNNGDVLSYDNWAENEPNCKCACGGITVYSSAWSDNSDRCKNQIAQSVCEIK
ncbi:snaclec 7-like [Ruditapes philippinarum]|uniref:snaclec 7-like n=1 Tax=Ruditapes philippinarum TaxID=129788 RepID=UPI00295BCE7A|nr:snaclec 7-like [Ruditapes philippinarum]